MTLSHSGILRASQYGTGIRAGKGDAALQNKRTLKVIGAANLAASRGVYRLTLVIAAAQAQHKLLARKQLAVDEGIGAHPRQKEAAHGAASKMDIAIPVRTEGVGPPTKEPPAGISIAALAGDLAIDGVASAGQQGAQIGVTPVGKGIGSII